jgi:hypothetical protein
MPKASPIGYGTQNTPQNPKIIPSGWNIYRKYQI